MGRRFGEAGQLEPHRRAVGPASEQAEKLILTAMRLAMAQISGSDQPAENREMMTAYTERAVEGGADVVVFPELTLCRTQEVAVPQAPMAENLDGPFVTNMRELAARHHVLMIAGMTERIVGEEVRAHNTVVAAGSSGEIVGTYRKIHLFDALGIVESDVIVRGDGATLVFPFGDQTIGIATCYDLRFPELARALVGGCQSGRGPTHGAEYSR
jgi:predicted amidohydrolase